MEKLKLNSANLENMDLPNYDIIHGVIGRLSNDLNKKLEDYDFVAFRHKLYLVLAFRLLLIN